VIRGALEKNTSLVAALAQRLNRARRRLDGHARRPRPQAPQVQVVFELAAATQGRIPAKLALTPGQSATLRGELGRALQYYNRASQGAVLTASADLYGSTSVATIGQGFPEGWYNATTNPGARMLATGGICEDAMSGILAGLSTYGRHLGVGSSYGAFIAALGHVAARLHAIGNQARQALVTEPYRPFVLVCAHAGVKTGEDGPTHADPQALQLLQGNFPLGTLITLTPWDPQEIWTLMSAALARRPAVIAPFVTRPSETVLDRQALGLAGATSAATGVYQLRRAVGKRDGTLVLQGSDVGYAFAEQTLPLLKGKGIDLDVFYVASAELFDLLPGVEREKIYPEAAAQEAMGITGFTLPTMERWICSGRGRSMTLHPFRKGRFLGSGQAAQVLEEAELDGESQFKAIRRYLERA
jgi:transketolase